MTPAKVDIEIYQGDRHEIYFRAEQQTYDEINEVWVSAGYMDLTGMTIRAQLRAMKEDVAAAADFTCTVITPQSDPAIMGSAMAVLLPSQTATLALSTYYWDLEISSDVDHVDTWFAGVATVTKQVTR